MNKEEDASKTFGTRLPELLFMMMWLGLGDFYFPDRLFLFPFLLPSFSRASKAGLPGAVTSVSFPGAMATPRLGEWQLLSSVVLTFLSSL